LSVDELIAANPQADPDHLTIGTKLNLYEVKPYLHLTLTEKITAQENIDYDIKYEETSTLYKGEVQVKIAGIYGQREVVKEVVKENGVIVSSTELEAQVMSEPQSQVMLKGTKSVSTLVGTGAFTSPMGYLEVSSPYGSRGGGRHTGVDFRNPKGTPIYVVDDGVITFAAYQGTYGNLVKVSHGNGVETWYAHCDTMLVKIGDVVEKGDQIATVGDTGRATGYHLHFEVRKNGVPQNPMNYL
jgi:murein DD-endopeptidase MepM/ murein hydrolase activator NlpD